MIVLVNKMYKSGDWLNYFLDFTIIALPKINQAKKCSDNRTISLISHTGKIVARIPSQIEEVAEEDQFRFRKVEGTIGLMRIGSKRVLDVKEEMCLCFIDGQTAFDRVDWTKLLEMLPNIGVSWRERRLIRNLYAYIGQRVKLRINQGETNSVEIGRGVRHRCCKSPTLFNQYGEYLMKEALTEVEEFKIGERVINKVKFADDTTTTAKTKEELQYVVDSGRKYNIEIYIKSHY
jgi:Reverse transcriptase (RNA-dependent DNA polymerase).